MFVWSPPNAIWNNTEKTTKKEKTQVQSWYQTIWYQITWHQKYVLSEYFRIKSLWCVCCVYNCVKSSINHFKPVWCVQTRYKIVTVSQLVIKNKNIFEIIVNWIIFQNFSFFSIFFLFFNFLKVFSSFFFQFFFSISFYSFKIHGNFPMKWINQNSTSIGSNNLFYHFFRKCFCFLTPPRSLCIIPYCCHSMRTVCVQCALYYAGQRTALLLSGNYKID